MMEWLNEPVVWGPLLFLAWLACIMAGDFIGAGIVCEHKYS